MTPWIIHGVTGKCFGLSKVLLTHTIYDDDDTLDHPRYFAYQRINDHIDKVSFFFGLFIFKSTYLYKHLVHYVLD